MFFYFMVNHFFMVVVTAAVAAKLPTPAVTIKQLLVLSSPFPKNGIVLYLQP